MGESRLFQRDLLPMSQQVGTGPELARKEEGMEVPLLGRS
jgi:hypothetical protein